MVPLWFLKMKNYGQIWNFRAILILCQNAEVHEKLLRLSKDVTNLTPLKHEKKLCLSVPCSDPNNSHFWTTKPMKI